MRKLILPVILYVGLCNALAAQAADEIVMEAGAAKIDGPDARYDDKPGTKAIRYWNNTNVVVSWSVQIPARGAYRVLLTYASPQKDPDSNQAEISIGNQTTTFSPVSTGGFGNYAEQDIGPVLLRKPGQAEVKLRFIRMKSLGWDFQKIRLVKED